MAKLEWITADWTIPGVRAGTTVRRGGYSSGPHAEANFGANCGDDAAAVTRNRGELERELGRPVYWLEQCHGVAVTEPGGPRNADAIIIRDHRFVAAVLTADCLPVLLAARNGEVAAAVHAGWRGLAAGVIENAVATMKTTQPIHAWLGPAISQPAFEVGDEVRQAFCDHDAGAAGCFVPNDRGRWQADLYGLARRRLNHLEVARISGGEGCTFRDVHRFYSYRRDGVTGRMASFLTIDLSS